MATKSKAKSAVKPRKTASQERARDTVAVLVEAAARILETRGFEGFNTNAVAEKAGVSIGSLYQYFPGKNALLSALIERETTPLLAVAAELTDVRSCREALGIYLRASVRHQMRRPRLARLLDIAETREIFSDQVSSTAKRLVAVIEGMLLLPDAPSVENRRVAAADLLVLTRSLIDAAGERGEGGSDQLMRRVEHAVWGYLQSE